MTTAVAFTEHGALLGFMPYALRYAIVIPIASFIGYKCAGVLGAVWTFILCVSMAVAMAMCHGNVSHMTTVAEWGLGIGVTGMVILDLCGCTPRRR